jgi:PAS domain S-box-containing protein
MSTHARLLELTKEYSFLELPIGVYVVALDGPIIEANKQAREILQLPLEGQIQESIERFYKYPEDRIGLPDQLSAEEEEGRYLISKLTFIVNGREVYIQNHARSIRDPVTRQKVGYLCCIMDITSEMRYRKMLSDLPVGIYVLDRDDRIMHVNDSFAELFGYQSASELLGKHIREFYADRYEAEQFRETLELEGELRDYIVQVRRQTGERLLVRVSATKITSAIGEYEGREGTVMEAVEERYRRILDVAPIGLFEVQSQDGQDKIIHYNNQFLTINEFDSKEQALHFDMKKLHASIDDYNQFIKELEESGQLLDREVRIHTLKGNEKVVRFSVRALRDPRSQKMTGRIGVVRDFTELKHKVEELTEDIGQVLHTYSTALVEIKQSSDAITQSLQPDPFNASAGVTPEVALKEIKDPVMQLFQLSTKLLGLVSVQERGTPLLVEKRDDLMRLSNMFENYEKEVPYPELHPAVLREATYELLGICDEIKSEKMLPRELVKQVRSQGQRLLRILNLFTLHQMRDLTFSMGHAVRALREFIISGYRVEQSKSQHDVSTLVTLAINNIREFAYSRGVQFRRKVECPEVIVNVVERDIIRALANILHNAIKYSWSRVDSSNPWVLIHVYQENELVHFEIENYGVPIPKDEIDKQLIFQFGYRGRESSDRGRTGTGVGLADALRVTREHGGFVTAQSRPAIHDRKKDNYGQPFLTTITLSLPVYQQKEENE